MVEYDDYLSLKSSRYPVSYVYDKDWNLFFTRGYDRFLYLSVILPSCILFPVEYESKTSSHGIANTIKPREKEEDLSASSSKKIGAAINDHSDFDAGCGIRTHVGLPPNGFQVFSGTSRIVPFRPQNAPIFRKNEPFSAR